MGKGAFNDPSTGRPPSVVVTVTDAAIPPLPFSALLARRQRAGRFVKRQVGKRPCSVLALYSSVVRATSFVL